MKQKEIRINQERQKEIKVNICIFYKCLLKIYNHINGYLWHHF
jgi:hypothetical protein